MKVREFLEQTQDIMQIVPTPFSVEAVKSEFMKKQAEFEYTGILVDNVEFNSEGSVLTLSQDGKKATVTFKYAEDVGPYAEVKAGQGESVNLDLTPLSPPVIETSIGKMVNVSDMSWMTVESLEGILSAANLKPVEIDPTAPPDNLGSQGSGASTKTSELPQGQTAELDAKQVPAPTPRAAIPGESLYSDGKPRYYPGIKVSAIDEIRKKNEIDVGQGVTMHCKKCGYVGTRREFGGEAEGDLLSCPDCGYTEIEDLKTGIRRSVSKKLGVPEKEESHHETKVSDLDVPTQHQIKIAQKTLKMSGPMAGVMGGMTKEEAREILKKYGMLPKGESLKEQEDDYRSWDEGRWVMVRPTGSASKKSKPAANWITKEQKVKLLEPAIEGTLDVFDVETESGEEESIYGFNIIGSAPDLESLYADGTSKYHPGLKQEAIHRVTWTKGKDTFVTDVEAGSEKEASKKVKDSVRADKIISVGKHVKENLRGEHKLKIISLHDGKAECSAGDWDFTQTGKVTKGEIQAEFEKHLKNIPESKNLTYFRFAIREGKLVKIPVGTTTASIRKSNKKIEKKESHKIKSEKIKKATEFLKRFGK